ncbi:glycosyl hydrolase family 28-related protein [Pendulispora albinea]|uniref:Rhamnogalacturonase A/B/Epimerase-like pectate lyase domain-containing protein n=1 Tax=Pendulispora albinea TaxID=2741071 RepID=A0ABZ2MBA0_9BACT
MVETDPRTIGQGSSLAAGADPRAAVSLAELPSCNQVAPDGIGGVLNVANFGAKPDGSDAYPGIQAAINRACALVTGTSEAPPAVYLPRGQYTTSRPLVATCTGFEMFGACRAGVEIAPAFQGPALVVNPPTGDEIPSAPGLDGSGNAAKAQGPDWHLDLRDLPAVELEGKSQLTVEAFIRLSASVEGYRNVVMSYGSTPPIPGGEAFALGVQAASATTPPYVRGVLTAGNKVIAIGKTAYATNECADAQPDHGAISLDQEHHIALTYDGSMARLFLDGEKVFCMSITGPVRQQPDETVSVGPGWFGLDRWSFLSPIDGHIDSVRISDKARYTSTFKLSETPHSENDAHTLALIDFEPLPAPPPAPPGQPALGNPPSLVLARSLGKDFWLPIRGRSTAPLRLVQNVRLHDFTIAGGMGLVTYNMATSQFWKMTCRGCDYGFGALGNNWGSHFNDLQATAAPERGRYGLISYSANGSEFHDIQVSGQAFPFAIASGAQTVTSNVTVTADNAKTVYGMYLYRTSPVLNGVTIRASGTSPVWRGAIAAAEPWGTFQLQRGQIGSAQNPNAPAPPIFLHRFVDPKVPEMENPGAVIQGTSFTGTASATEIVHAVTSQGGMHPKPVVILGATKDSSVPWSNETATTIVRPTDPSVVPDPNVVAAMAPGSDPVRGVVAKNRIFDVTSYGAKLDSSDDAYAAIQSAIDAACVAQNNGTPSTVFFPITMKFWVVSKPLLVHCNGLRIEGAQRDRSRLFAGFGAGPSLVLEPPGMTGLDLVPSLFGSGQAMKTNGSSYWLNLRDDHPSGELDGLGSFTAEAVIDVTAGSNGYGGIVQSHGCFGSGGVLPGCTSAFSLGMNGQRLVASMTVGGKSYSLEGGTIPLDTPYHVALTYSGSAIRLFASRLSDSGSSSMDGAASQRSTGKNVTAGPSDPTDPCAIGINPHPGLLACVKASGPVAQGLHEDVTVGPRTMGFDRAVRDPAMTGVIDVVRLSNKDRYPTTPTSTAYKTPASKFSGDADTLALVDFVTQVSNGTNTAFATRGYTSSWKNVWFPVRRTAEPNGTAEGKLSNVTVHDLLIYDRSGLFAMNAVGGHYASLGLKNSGFGMLLLGDSSDSTFDDVYTGAGVRLGFLIVNGHRNVYNNLGAGVGQIPLVVVGGLDQYFQNVLVDTRGGVYGAIFIDAGATVQGLYTDNEKPSDLWKSSLVVVNPKTTFQLFKGELDQADQTPDQINGLKPAAIPVIVDGGQGIRLMGTTGLPGTAHSSNLPPSYIYFNSPPQQKSVAIGMRTYDVRIPLSNTSTNFEELGN